VAGRKLSDDQLVGRAREAISGSGEKIDENVFNRFASRLSYVSGDVTGDSLYARLAQQIRAYHRPLYYLETPPSEDSIEQTWRIVQLLLDHPPDIQPYQRGSWGPRRRSHSAAITGGSNRG
jgi:glucose-6-phosphate 1-dehydrogenase